LSGGESLAIDKHKRIETVLGSEGNDTGLYRLPETSLRLNRGSGNLDKTTGPIGSLDQGDNRVDRDTTGAECAPASSQLEKRVFAEERITGNLAPPGKQLIDRDV
jgi:hypothetical protein